MKKSSVKFVGFMLMMALSPLCTSTPGASPLATQGSESNLLHYWPFDEQTGNTASDARGQLHGTVSGEELAWSAGKQGGALHLVNNSCVELDDNHQNDPHIRLGRSDGQYKGWTLAVWLNKQTNGPILSTSEYQILLKGNPKDNSKNSPQANLSLGRAGHADLTFNYAFEADQWVHITLVATATNTTLYVNGKREQILWDNQNDVDNSAKSAITFDEFHKVYEGYNSLPLSTVGCAPHAKGINASIDELKVYGAALTPEQVAQHYNRYVSEEQAVKYQAMPSAQRSGTLIPKPLKTELLDGEFVLTPSTRLYTATNNPNEIATAKQLIQSTKNAMGFELQIINQSIAPGNNDIIIHLDPAREHLGTEGYELDVTPSHAVKLTAAGKAGLFYASQSLLQLLPSAVGSRTHVPDVLWSIPAVRIVDKPRYTYRGYLLDVVRHFFTVDEVKNLIDQLAHYKLNYLHLHLTDDQGWRIQINSHPELTEVGQNYTHHGACKAKTCFYTQQQYQQIVNYALQKHITVIPEIDVPGHTTVFMKAKNLCGKSDVEVYGWVNNTLCFYNYPGILSYLPDFIRKPIETTLTETGFANSESAYQNILSILDDVFTEVAAITPGEYIHLGADESSSSLYPRFIFDVQNMINKQGKKAIGWNEMAGKIDVENMNDDTIIQYWVKGTLGNHKNKVLLSPFDKIYLDQKYHDDIDYGYNRVDIKTAYDWEPAVYLEGVDEQRVLGVEGTMWSESAAETGVVEFMSFPRQLGVAELGWSTPENRRWEDYRSRLQYHGERMEFLGINYYRSPEIWTDLKQQD
jgi:hexosaminidase